MKKLKVGLAGYGVVGKRRHLCIKSHPYLELISVCDQKKDNMKSIEGDVNRYGNYKDLLKDNIDILLICLTNDIAPEVTMAGLESGLHIFCEKPPGRSVEDIAEVIKIENKNPSLKLMYGFNHRFHDSVQDALEIIQSQKLGKIISLHGVYGKSKLITFNQSDWRTKREVAGGGVLLDQGIHMVDLMRLMAGEFKKVYSMVSNSHWGFDVEDNAYALMRTDEGIVGMLHSSATQWRHRFNLNINLEKGSLILGGILSGSKSYGSETLTTIYANPDEDNGDPIQEIKTYNKDPSWDKEIEVFTKFIMEDKSVDTSSSTDAFNTMKLVNKIYFNDLAWSKAYNIEDPELVKAVKKLN